MTATRTLPLLFVVGLAGAGTMIVELAAVRLLAPWFGTSSAVWTNVIGVVLVALSLGYLLGARWASQPAPLSRLGRSLAGAGLVTLLLPAVAETVARWFIPTGVALADSPALFTWGSLAASFVLFVPPALLLGTIGPLATQCLQDAGEQHAGTAGGRVLFAGTLGSLAGTFATTHVALPGLGLTWTFLGSGGLLVALALVVLFKSRSSRTGVMILLVTSGALISWSRFDGVDADPDDLLLASLESPYQSLRVIQRGSAESLERHLQVNEGLDSFQSIWVPRTGFLPMAHGYYYNAFALPLFWDGASDGTTEEDLDVCVIGFGAGTAWRVLSGASPQPIRMIGIEIDRAVLELGHAWMELPRDEPRLTLLGGWDGRTALRAIDRELDLVLLDAYANQSEIPAHLSSVEFFDEVEQKLAPDGYLVVNVGGFGFGDPIVRAVASTVHAAFDQRVLALRIPFSRNVALIVRRGGEAPEPGSADWRPAKGAGPDGDELFAALELSTAWRWYDSAGDFSLTDDCNPIDRLQEASLRLAGAEGVEPQ